MRIIPLFGSGVYGKSAVVTRQRRVNCYYEMRQDGDKAKVVIYGTPGLVLAFSIPTPQQGPTRGLIGINEASLYAVIYNLFCSLTPPASGSGPATVNASFALSTINGLVSMAPNPNSTQIMVVDGSAGYVYNVAANTFTPATAAWFIPGAKTVTNCQGYFVTEVPGTVNFAVSNINDATNGYALSIGAAAAYPDLIQAVDQLNGILIPFSQQHLEFWQNVGTAPPSQPFQLIQSSPIPIGLPAVFARAHVGEALVFLGETAEGVRRIYRIDGYAVTPISSEIDYIINQPGFYYQDAVACGYRRDTHPFFQITFPTMNRTFAIDLSTGIPQEMQTGISTSAYQRHSANISTYFAGTTILSDYQNGNIYTLVDTAFSDNGAPVLREIITKHQTKGYNRFRVPSLYLDMETGVGLGGGQDPPGLPVQGQNPIVSIECSKDNGRTWLPARLISLGAQGQYRTRVNARRFGQSRQFTWRIRMTDPVKFVITDGALRTKGKAETF